MKKFSFYSLTDSSQEVIGSTIALTRLSAAKSFAEKKHLSLKNFLTIFRVTR